MIKMNKENIPIITDREELYDKCENMEQLFDKYYLPLLDKYYNKIYELQRENKQLKELIDKIESLIKSKDNGTCIHNNERRGAYTFVLNFDETREFVWNLEDILKEVEI